MVKSDLFVACPKRNESCDIDTCPRFLQNVEIITSSSGQCSANGFCYERGTRYITGVPQECFFDKANAAALPLLEQDYREEMSRLDRIRQLISENYFFFMQMPTDGSEMTEASVMFDTIATAISLEIKKIDEGTVTHPRVACTWQKVLPEILSFPDDVAVYHIEDEPQDHPEAFEQELPNGEKVLLNYTPVSRSEKPYLDRVKTLMQEYLEKGVMLSRSKDSSSKELWAKALGKFMSVKDGWQLPESRTILDEMTTLIIEAASRLSVDLTLPDPSHSTRSSETAEAVVQRLQPAFDEQKKSIAVIARGVKSLNDYIKLFFGKFIKWFMPRKGVAQEDVKATIDKSLRYECLSRVTNLTHKTQLMAVIDYTYDNPIVYEKDRKYDKDSISLSEAAQAVFDANIEKWRLSPDAWTDFNQFKVACYQFRGKENDPYNYATK